MIIRGTSVMLVGLGVGLFIMAKIDPFFSYILMDWVGIFSMVGGVLILLIAFPFSDTGGLYDTLPAGACFIPFIRRDLSIAPVTGKRVFAGESFLEVKGAGVIEDLGVDTVLLWGRKKIRFALENLNYTPDPRFFNVCRELYRLGFDDEEDLKAILYELPQMDPVKNRMKKAYYLDRMAQIYWELTHPPKRGGERFVSLLKTYKTKTGAFGIRRYQRPVDEKQNDSQRVSDVSERLEKLIGGKEDG